MFELLLPGTKIKRWFLLFVLGLMCLILLFLMLFGDQIISFSFFRNGQYWVASLLLIIGLTAVASGSYKLYDRFVEVISPEKKGKVMSLLAHYFIRGKGPKIVVIGGGTGLPNVLMGLKKYTSNLTAVVAMADSGGSTGKLRDEFGILPPGDIRRSLIALSEDTPMLKELFATRFEKGGLKGHSFGNLFITALREVTGSDEKALLEAGKILNIRGQALPVTLGNANLHAMLDNGKIIMGESNIDIPKYDPKLKIVKVFLNPKVTAYQKAVEAIKKADMVVIGPGDLYTSIIANLLVTGIPEAIKKSKAKKVYVCNLMTKHGETDGKTASQHLSEILKYLKSGKEHSVDTIIINNKLPKKGLLKKYEKENSFLVENDYPELDQIGVEVVQADLLREPILVRHDPEKLAKVLMELVKR